VGRRAWIAALAVDFPCGGWGREELDITFRTGVNPSFGPAGKTCDAMLSCIAASQGPASVPFPLGEMPRAHVLHSRATHASHRDIELLPRWFSRRVRSM
jgi:hypothetical protein